MNDSEHYRPVTGLMRFALLLGVFASGITFVQLFGFPGNTSKFFAWTIASGMSATMIGAFYGLSALFAFLSWRQRWWANASAGIPGITLFLWVTTATMFLHWDRFHLAASGTAFTAAIAWVLIYLLDPPLVTAAWISQLRQTGNDPARAHPLHSAYRALLVLAALLWLAAGLVMFFAPKLAMELAPLPLTPLTSRTLGAWYLALGGMFATFVWENDYVRIRQGAISLLVLAVLLAICAYRFSIEFKGGLALSVHLFSIALIAIIGVLGLNRQRVP